MTKIRKIRLADIDYLYETGMSEDGFAVSQTSRFWDKPSMGLFKSAGFNEGYKFVWTEMIL